MVEYEKGDAVWLLQTRGLEHEEYRCGDRNPRRNGNGQLLRVERSISYPAKLVQGQNTYRATRCHNFPFVAASKRIPVVH